MAARLFDQQGYSATTMSDIAEVAGILAGSIYHHFPSKEDIAVDLLARYSSARTELGTAANRRARTAVDDPEIQLRRLAADSANLAFAHAAAVKLRALEAPSALSGRLAAASKMESPAFEKAWRGAVRALDADGAVATADLGLLRIVLQELSSAAPLHYFTEKSGEEIARHLCEVLLHGVLAEPVPFSELESSAAHEAAVATLSRWSSRAKESAGGTTAAVLAAARAEFARRGYEATTTRDIATAAGVGLATLYRRVESKEALFKGIIMEYTASLDEAFDAILSAGSSEPECLYAIVRMLGHASRLFAAETQIVGFGWEGRDAASSPVHEYSLEAQARLDVLADIFRRGLKSGSVRGFTGPEELAVYFRSVLWLSIHKKTRAGEDRVFSFLRQSLLHGALSPRPGVTAGQR